MKGMLEPEFEEHILGSLEIRKIFSFSKVGKIAGCYVTDGLVKSGANARVIRDGVIIYDGKIASIQREKDQVKEVKKVLNVVLLLKIIVILKKEIPLKFMKWWKLKDECKN